MLRAITLILFAAAVFASDVTYQADDLRPKNMPPIFQNGYLIVRDNEFSIFGPDGMSAYRIAKPEEGLYTNAAVDRDGIVVAGLIKGVSSENKSGEIVLFDRSGAPMKTIPTESFLPWYVAIGADGSLWTAGKGGVRRYSRDGKLLGSYLQTEGSPEWYKGILQYPALHVSGNRVGYVTHTGDREHCTWIEMDLDGKELGRWPMPQDSPIPAFVGDRTYASTLDGFVILDRAAGKWIPANVAAHGWHIGVDGDELVFIDRGTTTAHRVAPR